MWRPRVRDIGAGPRACLYAAGSFGAGCYALALLYMASIEGLQGEPDELSNYESRAVRAALLPPFGVPPPSEDDALHEAPSDQWNSFCLNRIHLDPKAPRFAVSCSIGDLQGDIPGGRQAVDHYTMGAFKVGTAISPLRNVSVLPPTPVPLDLILLVGGEFDEDGVAMATRAGWSHICIVDTESVPAVDTRTTGEWPAGEGGVVKPEYVVTFNRLLLFMLPLQYRAILYLDSDLYIPDVRK